MTHAKKIAARTWAVIRYLATGRTESKKQQKARTYYLARLRSGPSDDG